MQGVLHKKETLILLLKVRLLEYFLQVLVAMVTIESR